jgi:RNA polymerase sigma factor (sigma-70 family)
MAFRHLAAGGGPGRQKARQILVVNLAEPGPRRHLWLRGRARRHRRGSRVRLRALARLQHIANLPGYLFRVGQSRGRQRRQPVVFAVPETTDYAFEPALPEALASLTQRQRLAVVLVHGYGYTLREVAELTGIRPTTVQNHLTRGLVRLRSRMGVTDGT